MPGNAALKDGDLMPVDKALQLILREITPLGAERVPILEGLDRVLVEPAVANDNLPPFANSAMDGYAVRAADVRDASVDSPVLLAVVGDIPAGTASELMISPGSAARIMTGAPLPLGADAVVPVENTNEPWRNREGMLPAEISISRFVAKGDYIRWPGEDVRAGQEVLPAGHVLRAQEIGVLASLGITEIAVVKRPRIGILATGDELIPAEEPLSPGKIRNSNSYTISTQIKALDADAINLGVAKDTYQSVEQRLSSGISQQVDLFISTAGVSVGAYDVVKDVLEDGGSVGFWRVNMRPGKPLAFGRYGGIPYLGLPGNPVSAMVSFERFARPAILKMAGRKLIERPRVLAVVQEPISSDGRESYLRAVVRKDSGGYFVDLSGRQGSHVMTSLIHSNGLLIVPAGVKKIEAGEKVEVMMIDWPETVF